jgi:hypothetical protein
LYETLSAIGAQWMPCPKRRAEMVTFEQGSIAAGSEAATGITAEAFEGTITDLSMPNKG